MYCMLFYYKFLFMLLQRKLKYSHEVRILDRILKRSGSEKQSHCFFTNEILPFFLRHLSKPGQIASFNFSEIPSSLLILSCLFHIYHKESVHYRLNLIRYDFYCLERMSLVLLSTFIKLKLLTSPSSTKIHILSFLFLGTQRDSCELPASTAVAVLVS